MKGKRRRVQQLKRHHDKTLTLRLPHALYNALARDARHHQRSMGAQVRLICHVRFAANVDPDRILATLEYERTTDREDVENPDPREAKGGQHSTEAEE